jgi:hypothetical protein
MKNLFIAAMVCMMLSGAAGSVSAADPAMVNAVSIEVAPASPAVGQQPRVTGRIARTNAPVKLEPAMFNIIAVVKLPNNVTKSMTWKNETFERGQSKDYLFTGAYDTKQTGVYSVEYNVYSSDMRQRLATVSRTFSIGGPAAPAPKEAKTPPPPASQAGDRRSETGKQVLGIGAYGNVLNPAAGATLLYWPTQRLGLQASYTVGTFTTAEVRLLARFNPVWGMRPYAGVGYMNVSKTEDVIGVSTDFTDSSITGTVGAEVPLGRRWYGYAEVSAASVDLQKTVTNGGQTVKATVDYAPVTIGVGIVYYLF